MNINQLIDEINDTSLFDLYRIRTMLDRALDDPNRIKQIKRQLKQGQTIQYYNVDENKLLSARLLEVLKTRARVVNFHDGTKWTIPLFIIKLSDAEFSEPERTKVDRMTLQVGEHVGYTSKDGQDVYGVVTKLNPKTAEVQLNTGERWRVSYEFLFYVLDGEFAKGQSTKLIEGEIIA